jgi:hypothetical protein
MFLNGLMKRNSFQRETPTPPPDAPTINFQIPTDGDEERSAISEDEADQIRKEERARCMAISRFAIEKSIEFGTIQSAISSGLSASDFKEVMGFGRSVIED